MEKINTEILVSSLLVAGFDRVDAFLFSYTLGQISIDNRKLQMFDFKDSETTSFFNEYVDYDGISFKLREGVTLDTNVSPASGYEWSLKGALHTNKVLLRYLEGLDFREIILRKIVALGVDKLDDLGEMFCDREKEIIRQIFGMIEEPIETVDKAPVMYEKVYPQ